MLNSRRALISIGALGTLLLAGCGGQVANNTPANQPPPASGQPANTNKKLALVPGVANEPFYISMQCGAEEAAKAAGYTLQTNAPAKFDATLQEPIVTGLAATKPAALLIAPT